MAVPKKKTSKSRSKRRHAMRQKILLQKLRNRLNIVQSRDSGHYHLAHHVCLQSGMYRGKRVLSIKSTKASNNVVDA